MIVKRKNPLIPKGFTYFKEGKVKKAALIIQVINHH